MMLCLEECIQVEQKVFDEVNAFLDYRYSSLGSDGCSCEKVAGGKFRRSVDCPLHGWLEIKALALDHERSL